MSEGDGAQERASRGEHEASPRLSASDLAEMRKEIEARLDALLGPEEAVSSPPADAAEGSWLPTAGDEEHDADVAPPGDDGAVAASASPATSTPEPSAPSPSRPSARDADDAEERLRQARQRMAERQAEAERAASDTGSVRRGRAGGRWARVLLWGAVLLAVGAAAVALWLAGG